MLTVVGNVVDNASFAFSHRSEVTVYSDALIDFLSNRGDDRGFIPSILAFYSITYIEGHIRSSSKIRSLTSLSVQKNMATLIYRREQVEFKA